MAFTKVAIAGATGNLGPHIVKELVNQGFEVTILSASGNTSSLPFEVKTIKVDFSSRDSVVSALRGQEAFVSAIPKHEEQPALIDAAIAAGVQRFIPSEFGSNIVGNEKVAALPVFGGKVKTQEYLRAKQEQISYTLITNGLFVDWFFGLGLGANLKGKTQIFDNGDSRHSFTLLSDIGKAVAGVLKHPEETKNRGVYVQTIALSQNQALKIAQKAKPDFKPETENVDLDALEKNAYGELSKEGGNVGGAMFDFIKVSIFRDGYGNLWDEKNDNELLGIKGLSESELEAWIAKNATYPHEDISKGGNNKNTHITTKMLLSHHLSLLFLPTFLKPPLPTMPSYFLPYPKNKQHHKPPPLQIANPYPHPHPDPPSNPPSPLNLSASPSSPTSSSSSSTIKPRKGSKKHVHWKQDYHPSVLKLKIVCGDPEDPSLVVVFGLRFREGRRPKVRLSIRRGHGRTMDLGDRMVEGANEGKGGRDGVAEDEKRHDEDQEEIGEERGRKRRRECRSSN
ncbi:NAD(P)-binding protein [Aureobasidium subglaciale]|nr:NAD(P)-binding protein [Aureobasidium subglaciale]